MIEKVSGKLTQFYQVSLVTIMLLTLGVILYFWQLGFIDGSKGKDLHQASFILEKYQQDTGLAEVKKLIYNESPKLAIDRIKSIESELLKVNQIIKVKQFNDVEGDLQKLKTSAANLISFSKITKILSVFNSKLDKFSSYVQDNKWRTLSRMTDRVNSQTNGHINKNKIGKLVTNVMRDFDNMIKITEKSVLERKEKSEVISRITNLKIEMEMLKKYAEERKFYTQLHGEAEGALTSWVKKVSPEVTLQKLEVEQIGKYFVIGLLGILAFVSVIFFSSFMINRFYFKRARNTIEKHFEDYVTETLLEGKPFQRELFSEDFHNFSSRMSDYFHKRMSFGSIFQEALPFSAVLLDNNLKVLWGNKQFCSDMQVSEEEMNKDYMSWDYLHKLTNLGDNDPVIEALKNQVAGIYQIKVKPNSESHTKPFEMFISPVKYKGQLRIMVFFYDLTNLEDTIQEQARCLLSPIHKSLDLMFNSDFQASDDLAQEFAISDNQNIYDQFVRLNQKIEATENKLLDQIELYLSEINEFEKQNEKLRSMLKDSLDESKQSMVALKTFKENVIGLASLAHELDESHRKSFESLGEQTGVLKNTTVKMEKLKELSHEIFQGMPKINEIKEQIRESKTVSYEAKSKLGHDLAQLSLIMKRAHKDADMEKLNRNLSKLNESYETFSGHAEELDKKISTMELFLSKVQLLVSNGQQRLQGFDYQVEQAQVAKSYQALNALKELRSHAGQDLAQFEAEIIASLQNIFNATKQHIQINGQLQAGFHHHLQQSEKYSENVIL